MKYLKELHGRKKLEYLWNYYRFVLYIAACILMAAIVLCTMFHNKRQITLFSIVVADADRQQIDEYKHLEEDLLKVFGTNKKNEKILIDTAATSNEDDEATMNLTMKLSVVEENDILICNEKTYERFHAQNAFADWSEILGEETDKFDSVVEKDKLVLSACTRWEDGNYVQYSPVYACVLNSSKKKEKAKLFAEYFFESNK